MGNEVVMNSQVEYSIALQRAVEHHCNGKMVPPSIAMNCPHHALLLNENLRYKHG